MVKGRIRLQVKFSLKESPLSETLYKQQQTTLILPI
jgi:hypothetical protein